MFPINIESTQKEKGDINKQSSVDDIETPLKQNKVNQVYVHANASGIRKGQIRWCNMCKLNDDGIRIHKIRPCIIFQTDIYNGLKNAEIFVVPLSGCDEYILEDDDIYMVNFIGTDLDVFKQSYVCFNRMTFIEKNRVQSYIGECPKNIMNVINDYIVDRLGIKRRNNNGKRNK